MKLIPRFSINNLLRLISRMSYRVIAFISAMFLLICAMLMINYKIIKNVEQSIINTVDHDLKGVIHNASLDRFLNKMSAETNLLIHTFTKQEVLLKEEQERLVTALEEYNPMCMCSDHESDQLPILYKNYVSNVIRTLNHCESIDSILKDIRSIDREIQDHLSLLETTLTDQKISQMAEGGGQYIIENTQRFLPVYREYSFNIAFELYRTNQEYILNLSVPDDNENKIVKMLDDFDTALTELTISGDLFSELGRQLRSLVAAYTQDIIQIHVLMKEFRPILMEMDQAQQDIIALTEKFDRNTTHESQNIKTEISRDITALLIISTAIFILFNSLSIGLCFFAIRMFKVTRIAQELQKALEEIRTLKGIVPICSFCKKIRDDRGYWEQVEVYVRRHSHADFSHGICPECMKKHYSELDLSDPEP